MQSIIVGKSEKCDGLGFRTQAGLVRRVFLELEMAMLCTEHGLSSGEP